MKAPRKPAAKPKPSGAAYRKQRRERAQQAAQDELTRRASKPGGRPAAVALGPVPASALERIAWANRAAALTLEEIMADEQLESERRWKLSLEAVRSIGMVGPKALYEARLSEISARLYGDPNSAVDVLTVEIDDELKESRPMARPNRSDSLEDEIDDSGASSR